MAPFQILSPTNLRQLELLQLRSRRRFLGTRQGGNASLKRGHGIEFADYRRYERGDDPRHIDWGVYGRTDRLYVKQFQEEQDLTVFCLLDSTASMHHPASDGKFEHACEIALGMMYIALSQHERVHLTIPGHAVLGPSSGPAFIHSLADVLADAPEVTPELHGKAIRTFLTQIRYPGVCLYFSDFCAPLDELQRQLELLYVHNLDVILFRLTGAHDRDPSLSSSRAIFIDSETNEELNLEWTQSMIREYQFRYDAHEQQLRQLAMKYQMRYFSLSATDSVMEFFFQELPTAGVVRS
ncbi:MAG: DUF58 domain-containing protein [Bdellovibrionota bacterium]